MTRVVVPNGPDLWFTSPIQDALATAIAARMHNGYATGQPLFESQVAEIRKQLLVDEDGSRATFVGPEGVWLAFVEYVQ